MSNTITALLNRDGNHVEQMQYDVDFLDEEHRTHAKFRAKCYFY